MAEKTNKLYERLLSNKEYKQLLDQLPENERVLLLKSIKKITERFENEIYQPLKNYLGK